MPESTLSQPDYNNYNYYGNPSNPPGPDTFSNDIDAASYPAMSNPSPPSKSSMSTNDKVATENATLQPKQFALLFEEEGDTTGTKFVMYNCVATRPTRSFATTTDTVEPQTQTSTITASPLADGRTMSWTTATTPAEVLTNWYDEVWLADTTTGVGG